MQSDSPMRAPAEQFLTLRAYGAPAIVIALAVQGTFRGFKDTKTPLYALGLGNLTNAILDAIFILLLGLGVRGAAIATVTSEGVAYRKNNSSAVNYDAWNFTCGKRRASSHGRASDLLASLVSSITTQ